MTDFADAERAELKGSAGTPAAKRRRFASAELPDPAFVEDITAELTRLGMPEYQARMIAKDTRDYRSVPSQSPSLQKAA